MTHHSSPGNWFRVNRALTGSDLWLSEPFTRGQAWVDLIGMAGFRAGYVRIRDVRVNYQRGQIATSLRFLATRWQWSVGKVQRFISELENDAQISTVTNNVSTVISITNYDKYQSGEHADEYTDGAQVDTQTSTQTGTQTEQIKERKEPKKARTEKKEKQPRGKTPAPPVFELPEAIATESMKAAAAEWVAYRAERRKPLTATSLAKLSAQIADAVAADGEAAVLAMFDRAIGNGWNTWNFPDATRNPQRPSESPRGSHTPGRATTRDGAEILSMRDL